LSISALVAEHADDTLHTPLVQVAPLAQSDATVQVVLQAVGPHTYGSQFAVLGAGQAPLPLQVAAAVATPLVQLALRQEVVLGASWQTLPAAQSPVLPQGGAATQRASAPPTLIAAHVPLAAPVRALLHAVQVPEHAELQQKPSTHEPEAHCVAAEQACPTAAIQAPFEQTAPAAQARPHAPQLAGSVLVLTQAPLQFDWPAAQHTPPAQATHRPPEHCAPAAQLALVVQLVVQALLPQMNGVHGFVVAATQLPLPSQAGAGVSVPLVHEALPQLVPASVLRQAPAPLHVPSFPQGAASVQRLSATPLLIGAQVPLAWPVMALLHAMQVPQVPLQHTPSTHEPEAQFALVVQAWPRSDTQALLEQTLPAPHETPHAPQFGLLLRSVQLPPQHDEPAAQTVPQLPQCAESELKS